MQFSKNALVTCGADRVRTDDIQLAKLALSQLSYSPNREKGHLTPGTAPGEPPETARWA